MSAQKEGERLRDREAAGELPPALRLQRLKARAERQSRDEAYWTVAEAVEALLRSAELLLKATPQADVLDALDGIFTAISSLLDGTAEP